MDTFNLNVLKSELERDEGRRSKPYKDTEDIWTIGVGWNLEARGLPTWVIDRLFDISVQEAETDARALFKNFDELTPARQRVVINMAFNMGRDRLKGFKKMIAAVHSEDWTEAAVQMLDSKWARQVGTRADRLAAMMESGE